MPYDTRYYSPADLAEIVGVSESSVRRWVDQGLITVSRTVGGHRRIDHGELLRFVRARGMRILRPDLLGERPPDRPDESAAEPLTGEGLYGLLKADDRARVPAVLARAYLDYGDLASLFDGPLAGALERFGRDWLEDEQGIYWEHRATVACIEAIHQLRMLLPPAREDALVALGAAPAPDPYIIPTLMASLIVAEGGFRDVNLGPDASAPTILDAVEAHGPTFVWLASNALLNEEEARSLVRDVLEPLSMQSIDVVIGGRATLEHGDIWRDHATLLGSMRELSAFVAKHPASTRPGKPGEKP